MATSQNTWGDVSIGGVKDHAGEPQHRGGEANPTPNTPSGNWDGVNVAKMRNVGWASPNAEADCSKTNVEC